MVKSMPIMFGIGIFSKFMTSWAVQKSHTLPSLKIPHPDANKVTYGIDWFRMHSSPLYMQICRFSITISYNKPTIF